MAAGARPPAVQALAFDTYGTVVDWRRSLLAALERFGERRRIAVDWGAFLAEWKAAYRPGMDRVNRGDAPWMTVDEIYARALEALLPRYGLPADPADVAELTGAWRRLAPWPDVRAGLERLRRRYVITPLSNASFAGMVHLARFARLPWDCVITAENARCYKPRPEVYQTAVALLGLRPADVLMVAAHNYDLHAARAVGLRTAFVPRPEEHGPGQTTDLAPEAAWDVIARDLGDLADRLGA